MRANMPVNYISAVKNVIELCPQYERALAERHRNIPFGYEELITLNTYLSYAKAGCYLEMEGLAQRISLIKDAGALVALAQKMEQATAPIIRFYKRGLDRLEENPDVEMEISQWLALYFNELNRAIYQRQTTKDPEEIKAFDAAIKELMVKICHHQDEVKKLPPESISEVLKQFNQLCAGRMDQIDPKGLIREALRKDFLNAYILPNLPQMLDLASQLAFIWGMSYLSNQAVEQGGWVKRIFLSYALSNSAIGLYHGIQARNLLSVATSLIILDRVREAAEKSLQ